MLGRGRGEEEAGGGWLGGRRWTVGTLTSVVTVVAVEGEESTSPCSCFTWGGAAGSSKPPGERGEGRGSGD